MTHDEYLRALCILVKDRPSGLSFERCSDALALSGIDGLGVREIRELRVSAIKESNEIINGEIRQWETHEGVTLVKRILPDGASRVIDFGCGVGYYAIATAFALNGNGNVYAIDVGDAVLNSLRGTLASLRITNVVPIKSSEEIVFCPCGDAVDLVMAFDVLHLLSARGIRQLIIEAHRALRGDGRLALTMSHMNSEKANRSGLTIDAIVAQIEANGFALGEVVERGAVHFDKFDHYLKRIRYSIHSLPMEDLYVFRKAR